MRILVYPDDTWEHSEEPTTDECFIFTEDTTCLEMSEHVSSQVISEILEDCFNKK